MIDGTKTEFAQSQVSASNSRSGTTKCSNTPMRDFTNDANWKNGKAANLDGHGEYGRGRQDVP